MRNFVHRCKMEGLTVDQVDEMQRSFGRSIPPGGIAFYQQYQETLARCQAMDFDDLLLHVVLLLRRHEQVRQTLTQRFRFVLVDDFKTRTSCNSN